MHARFDMLENARKSANPDAIVASASRPPRTLFATELSTDPANFRNACMAAYFGLRSIRLGHAP
jgi:hypothetical protein